MDINIPISGNNYYGYAFDVLVSIDPNHLIYGYGYGNFDISHPSSPMTYFDVLSIEGDVVGYGAEPHSLTGYAYGWGYEITPNISGDNNESIEVTATVTDNGSIPDDPSGIPVLFTGSPGITFSKNLAYTDSNGQASVSITMDSSVLRNIDFFGSTNVDGERPVYVNYPPFGYMKVEATIPKCLVTNDWDLYINLDGSQSFGEDTYETLSIPSVAWSNYIHFSGDLTGDSSDLYSYTISGLVHGKKEYKYSIVEIPTGVDYEKGPWLVYTYNNPLKGSTSEAAKMTVLFQTDAAATGVEVKWAKEVSFPDGDNSFITGVKDIQNAYTFYAYGDSRTGPDNQDDVFAQLLSDVDDDLLNNQTILLHTGDWTTGDTNAQWDSQHFDRTKENILDLHTRIPIMGCPGNHDVDHTPGYRDKGDNFRKFYPYGQLMHDDPFRFYFSFDYGSAHIVVLDQYDLTLYDEDDGKVYEEVDLYTADKYNINVLCEKLIGNDYVITSYQKDIATPELYFQVFDSEGNVIVAESQIGPDIIGEPTYSSGGRMIPTNDGGCFIPYMVGNASENNKIAIFDGNQITKKIKLENARYTIGGGSLPNGNVYIIYTAIDETSYYIVYDINGKIVSSPVNIEIDYIRNLSAHGNNAILLDNGKIALCHSDFSNILYLATIDQKGNLISDKNLGVSGATFSISVSKFSDGKIMIAYTMSANDGDFIIYESDGLTESVSVTAFSDSANTINISLSPMIDGDMAIFYNDFNGTFYSYFAVYDSNGNRKNNNGTPIRSDRVDFVSASVTDSGNLFSLYALGNNGADGLSYSIINPVPQYRWLVDDIAATDKEWKIAVLHNPAVSGFSSGHDETETESVNSRTNILPLLGAAGFQLIFSGHCHCYSRSIDDTYGMTHITTGGGGAPLHTVLYDSYPESVTPAAGTSWVVHAGASVYHYMRMDVSGSSMDITMTDKDGNELDTATITST